MNRFAIRLYSKVNSLKNKFDMEFANYKLQNNPNVTVSPDAVIFPEAHCMASGLGKIVIGEDTFIRGDIQCLSENGKIEIGKECYIGEGTHIWSSSNITIGNRVLIGHNCNIFDNTTHPIDAVERNDAFINICKNGKWKAYDSCYSAPIYIRDDVWIGCNCIILRGVTIGEGAIVGAGSVVTKNVEPYTMVAGNPAKFVKKIEETRDNECK